MNTIFNIKSARGLMTSLALLATSHFAFANPVEQQEVKNEPVQVETAVTQPGEEPITWYSIICTLSPELCQIP